ncbi:PREDICTED: serine/threonine-protein phosphatase 4 regulatory subunit 1-like [Dufourea novaeangliae]|uniref:Serine/threonine-protein phosphatase 4 regulatory subunit 1 n=1 Tax=Dufourea novaeangliae TaxID=178035 RepID=A0A154P917_DUFNO|nr:PREDICTED: serine/threonine-protein phosphatase 4 regulatory subunit 1-like [Dufourea novaeangliae]KZC08405.1 Serine/threonine-protein phosphatase 4 regulatory subunit 1 [Dufourea novaeangliae]
MQSVRQITDDPDTRVRTDLVKEVPQVALICQEAPHLFGDVLHNYMLQYIIEYLRDSDSQVRLTAQETVLTLIKKGLLDNNAIEVKICAAIDVLCRSVDFLTLGISLMIKMAPFIGKDLTEKLFLDRYICLCKDEVFCVRNISISHFGEFCGVVGRKALFRQLFPLYVDLCCDQVWGIRKACVDVMIPVSCCMTLQHRRLLLADLLATHLNDESKWVRISAFQILGPFISTFAEQFTDISYNQQGELVFTRQQDSGYSIRYSYEDIFPTKCRIRSHTLDAEDNSTKENFNSSVIVDKPIYEEENPEEDEFQEDDVSMIRACKSKIQKYVKMKEVVDDSDKYSPFLYYYIAPDLPPDDELVEAAKRSTAQNNKSRKSRNTSNKPSTLTDLCNEDKYGAGEFDSINYNKQEIVPNHLIDSFLSMAEPEHCLDMGADIPHHCAFSFPAVALTLGRKKWPDLQEAYILLAMAKQWKVRRTVASGIHEIAVILGKNLTADVLVPIHSSFVKDLDEVRIGILKNLATFLKLLEPRDRYLYLPMLKEFLATDNESNWRFREELATQLLETVRLFQPYDVERYIAPLSFTLLSDKVAAVRHVALSLVTKIVAYLTAHRHSMSRLFKDLRCSLGVYAEKWTGRQTYAFLCGQLVSNNAITRIKFSRELLPILLQLSTDKVPNVRLAVARTLLKDVVPMGPCWLDSEEVEEVEKILLKMQSDPDRDVRVLAGGKENPTQD